MGMTAPPETWVFAYGSLMWNPGFDAPEAVLARLDDYARSFCMWSIHHRGTEEDPGLVLALDTEAGASCWGMAFRLPDDGHDAVLAELRERELISSAYYEARVPLALDDGRQVEALAYIVARDHVQYCGGLPMERQAQVIAHAVGGRGPNMEYLFNTAAHLTELGIEDADLTALAQRVRELNA
ncbi:MAG: gamma-glutamylcyclotransferase [Rhodobacteraceae bacterium]|nr:gamma-glutamylcyclotransferase [Paracoccaceae bacterium]